MSAYDRLPGKADMLLSEHVGFPIKRGSSACQMLGLGSAEGCGPGGVGVLTGSFGGMSFRGSFVKFRLSPPNTVASMIFS